MDAIKILGDGGELSHLLPLTQSIAQGKRESQRPAWEGRRSGEQDCLDVLTIAPFGFEEKETLPQSRILLLPGTNAGLIRNHPTDCVISYGTAEKDSVSISSIEEGAMMLSIQRELLTICGEVVARKELMIPLRRKVRPIALLFWAGLSLVLGLAEEEMDLIARDFL